MFFSISLQAGIRNGESLKILCFRYLVLVLELLSNTLTLIYLSSIIFLKFPSILTLSGKTGYREVKPEVRQPVCSTVSNWTPGSQAATVITVLHSSNLYELKRQSELLVDVVGWSLYTWEYENGKSVKLVGEFFWLFQ